MNQLNILTKDQIKVILKQVERYDIKYDYLNDEIADHIICEIEDAVSLYNMNFENALIYVFDKWDPLLKPNKKSKRDFLLKANIKSKYNRVPAFISKTWEKKDDYRWRIAGFFTSLLALLLLFYKPISKIQDNIVTFFTVSVITLGLLLTIRMYLFYRKKASYRATYLRKNLINCGITLFCLLLLISASTYESFKTNSPIQAPGILISLITSYQFLVVLCMYYESFKQLRKKFA